MIMRKLLLCVLILLPALTRAQTVVEEFKGEKAFEVCRFFPVVKTDIKTGQRTGFLGVFVNGDGQGDALIPYEDITPALDALRYAKDNLVAGKPEAEDVSCFHTTEEGHIIGVRYELSSWMVYVRLFPGTPISATTHAQAGKALDKVISAIEGVKSVLEEKTR